MQATKKTLKTGIRKDLRDYLIIILYCKQHCQVFKKSSFCTKCKIKISKVEALYINVLER